MKGLGFQKKLINVLPYVEGGTASAVPSKRFLLWFWSWLGLGLLVCLAPASAQVGPAVPASAQVGTSAAASAQVGQAAPATHRAVVGDLAFTCVEQAFSESKLIRMNGSGAFTLVEPVMLERLLAAGKKVSIEADNTPNADVLTYRIESVRVELGRENKHELNRTVFLDMTYQVSSAAEGQVLDAKACSDSFADTIPRSTAKALAHNDFPELNPEIPSGSVFSRWIQPAVLVGATAVGTYLLFNLRSRRADGG